MNIKKQIKKMDISVGYDKTEKKFTVSNMVNGEVGSLKIMDKSLKKSIKKFKSSNNSACQEIKSS